MLALLFGDFTGDDDATFAGDLSGERSFTGDDVFTCLDSPSVVVAVVFISTSRFIIIEGECK